MVVSAVLPRHPSTVRRNPRSGGGGDQALILDAITKYLIWSVVPIGFFRFCELPQREGGAPLSTPILPSARHSYEFRNLREGGRGSDQVLMGCERPGGGRHGRHDHGRGTGPSLSHRVPILVPLPAHYMCPCGAPSCAPSPCPRECLKDCP